MEHIGEILRTAREDNFYTQKKVIELTGINRKTLSGYENSVAEPDLDTFARLLRLYQLSADEVLGIKTSTPPLSLSENSVFKHKTSSFSLNVPLKTE